MVVPFTFTFAVVNGNFVRERLPATNRDTNAAAESFNAKLKDFGLPNTNKSSNIKLQVFRTQFRGVLDIKFFLFRVAKIFT